VEELNVGGGLGARYLLDDPEIAIADYAKTLRAALEDAGAANRLDHVPRLTVEPGRSIVAPAAITLYRVGTVKAIPDVATYVAVDGGMSDNPRPVLYGSGYEAFLPRAVGAERPVHARVVGKHCESGDVLLFDARLPADVAVGDVLATPVTGAYGHSMGSNYNKIPRPPVVFVKGGEARVVVRRETYDDLLATDVG
jgi:diaminopimelate decarboxylase